MKTCETQWRPLAHSLSASQLSQTSRLPRMVVVHVPSERRQLCVPQRAASVSPVHATHAPRLSSQTGVAVSRAQSASWAHGAHVWAGLQREAVRLVQSVGARHSTHVSLATSQ